MRTPRSLTNVVGGLLFGRGLLLIAAGLVVVRWPDETVLPVLIFVAIFSVSTGLADIVASASRIGRTIPASLGIAHGVVFVIFGALTAFVPTAGFRTAMIVAAAWLTAAVVVGFMVSQRRAKLELAFAWPLGWTTVHIVLAGVVIAMLMRPQPTSFIAVLYGGAVYAGLLGLVESGLGLWLHRMTRGSTSLATR